MLPFSYFNQYNELVGFDVALVFRIAKRLKVNIRWVPFDFDNLVNDFNANRFDMAIGGIYLNHYRTKELGFSEPYYQSHMALVIRKSEINRYESIENINREKSIKIASFNDPILIPAIKSSFPNAKIILVEKYDESVFNLLSAGKVDAIVWSKAQARVWSYGFPSLSYIIPKNFNHVLLFSILLPKGENYFSSYINYTLKQLAEDGGMEKQKLHWIYGHPNNDKITKWNIIDWGITR